jgi:hypothetical protein
MTLHSTAAMLYLTLCCAAWPVQAQSMKHLVDPSRRVERIDVALGGGTARLSISLAEGKQTLTVPGLGKVRIKVPEGTSINGAIALSEGENGDRSRALQQPNGTLTFSQPVHVLDAVDLGLNLMKASPCISALACLFRPRKDHALIRQVKVEQVGSRLLAQAKGDFPFLGEQSIPLDLGLVAPAWLTPVIGQLAHARGKASITARQGGWVGELTLDAHRINFSASDRGANTPAVPPTIGILRVGLPGGSYSPWAQFGRKGSILAEIFGAAVPASVRGLNPTLTIAEGSQVRVSTQRAAGHHQLKLTFTKPLIVKDALSLGTTLRGYGRFRQLAARIAAVVLHRLRRTPRSDAAITSIEIKLRGAQFKASASGTFPISGERSIEVGKGTASPWVAILLEILAEARSGQIDIHRLEQSTVSASVKPDGPAGRTLDVELVLAQKGP